MATIVVGMFNWLFESGAITPWTVGVAVVLCVVVWFVVIKQLKGLKAEEVCAVVYCLGGCFLAFSLFRPDHEDKSFQNITLNLKVVEVSTTDDRDWILIHGTDRDGEAFYIDIESHHLEGDAMQRIEKLTQDDRVFVLGKRDEANTIVPTGLSVGDAVLLGREELEEHQKSMTQFYGLMTWVSAGILILIFGWHVYIIRFKANSRAENPAFVFGAPIMVVSLAILITLNEKHEWLTGSTSLIFLLAVTFPVVYVSLARHNKRFSVAVLSTYGKYHEAIEAADALSPEDRRRPKNMLGLVRAYFRTEQFEKARATLDAMGDRSRYEKEVQAWMNEWEEEFRNVATAENDSKETESNVTK